MSLAAKLLAERDKERRCLARRLHSTAAQQLAALQFKLDMAAREPKAISDSQALTLDCALEIRRICYELYPPLLDEMGLTAALSSGHLLREIDAHLPKSLGRLPQEIEIGIFRIIEEAAPRISRLKLERKPRSLTLEFDLRAPSPEIGERVKALKGRIAARSGTLRITVPLQATAAGS